MTRVAQALLLLALGLWILCGPGCRVDGVEYVAWPEGDRAADFVWTYYDVRTRARPAVRWVAPASLDCGGGNGWVDAYERCVAGMFRSDTWTADVAHPDGVHVADTALAHELCHALTDWHGYVDAGHAVCYQGGGLVQQVQAELRRAF
ncbi:MAG TPA: hypothetical protein VD931_10395 [Baekduia sp.]|nr:hypothetical protein [Baekduia sp.]